MAEETRVGRDLVKLRLEIVTPSRQVIDTLVDQVQLPGSAGYLDILPGHAPLLTSLGIGEIVYRTSDRTQFLAVAWGFAEVLPERVIIMAEVCEAAEEIDVSRAEAAKARAEQRLNSRDPSVDYARAQNALERADARLQATAKLKVR